jgi:hypothetical protein
MLDFSANVLAAATAGMQGRRRTASPAELDRSLDELLSCLAEWSEHNRLGIKHARARFDLEMSKEKRLRAIVEGVLPVSRGPRYR